MLPIGSVDFAGGNVVHISSGVSALVLAIYLANGAGIRKQPTASTIFHLLYSAHHCSGSVGTDSTQEARLQLTDLQLMHL